MHPGARAQSANVKATSQQPCNAVAASTRSTMCKLKGSLLTYALDATTLYHHTTKTRVPYSQLYSTPRPGFLPETKRRVYTHIHTPVSQSQTHLFFPFVRTSTWRLTAGGYRILRPLSLEKRVTADRDYMAHNVQTT